MKNKIKKKLSLHSLILTVDIQKENVLKDLEVEEVEYELVGEFLMEIKKEFRREDEKSVKVVKFKKME